MSGFRSFLKRHRMTLIVPPLLAGEFYLWWRIQQMECYVPPEDKTALFVKPFQYAEKLYGGSTSNDTHADKKSL